MIKENIDLEKLPNIFNSSYLDISKINIIKKQLKVETLNDLLKIFPYRYENRSIYPQANELQYYISNKTPINIVGKIKYINNIQTTKPKLIVNLSYESIEVQLLWFKGFKWIEKKIRKNMKIGVFGKLNWFNNSVNMIHPEIDFNPNNNDNKQNIRPIYSSTNNLNKSKITNKHIMKLFKNAFSYYDNIVKENLPADIISKEGLLNRREALFKIHFPLTIDCLKKAKKRLILEEFFYFYINFFKQTNSINQPTKKSYRLTSLNLLNLFVINCLSFDLTSSQKKVIREIYEDLKSGKQMNRILQGDVGSGKTIVAFLTILIAISSGYQVAFVVPTEILAEQHYKSISNYIDQINSIKHSQSSTHKNIVCRLLTGSVKKKDKITLSEQLLNNKINILIGTHALFEDNVQFDQLGLVIIDEQHKFGVVQRSKLWDKGYKNTPHILSMTATPIPRTLSLTLYSNLNISTISDMPHGRKEIKTIHVNERARLKVFGLIHKELKKNHQAYVVYPIIEESSKLDFNNLMDGYEVISKTFSGYKVGIVHGKMSKETKELEMQRFLKNETQILVTTTVIEVGVNVSNATVIVIENAERYGLAQLHQLRGRVGRSNLQSYCILLSSFKLSNETKERLNFIAKTSNGFEIAEQDLRNRGPGDLLGTLQSGRKLFNLGNIYKDYDLLKKAQTYSQEILKNDFDLITSKNQVIKQYLEIISNEYKFASIS